MNNSKIPIMKKHQLSYLIGMFLGDGCVYINNKNKKHPIYQFSITGEDYDILEICHDIIKKRFNKTGKIKEIYKNGKFSYFQLLVCSKKICYFFKGLTKSRTRIPFIKKEDVMSRKYLCSGLMDSDG
jgi:DNA-binding transcriptional regulator WhiA